MKTFNDLQVSIGDTPSGVVTSPQEYSHMFRALYNGSYLSHEASERALNLLSKTTFTDGLVAGVPANTIVSHKFGERSPWLEDHASSASEENVNQLHDCGIVYFPSHPYFLCVMTKGQAGVDFPLLATVIQDISRVTWEHVNDKNK
jgi:hypothetical protein